MKNPGIFLLFGLALATAACDQPNSVTPTADGSCPAQTAEVRVSDGFQQVICGCQETMAILNAGTPLTCTVPVGTTVFFVYLGSQLPHQVISTASPSFVSSPVSDPSLGPSALTVYGVQFTAAGSYAYQDSYSSALSGTIVAQ